MGQPFLVAQSFLLTSYVVLLLLVLLDLSFTTRKTGQKRQLWPFRWCPTMLLVIGCLIRIGSISVLIHPPCNGDINNDYECSKVNIFTIGFGFFFFFAAKVFVFLLLYELRNNLTDGAPSFERKSQIARLTVLTFTVVVFIVNSILSGFVAFLPKTTILTQKQTHLRVYVGLAIEGSASAIVGTVGLILGVVYSRQLLALRSRRSAAGLLSPATRITFACVVCFLTFWLRAAINMTVGLHRPAFELFFERAWLQAWTIWLFEVLPSVTVVLAMGSYIRSTTFGADSTSRLLEMSRETVDDTLVTTQGSNNKW